MPLVFLSVCLVFSPGCKTSEESATTWDPSGVWNFSFTLTITLGSSTDIQSWTEPLNFTGTDQSGTVSGFTWETRIPSQNGTYTRTGNYGINILFDFTVGTIHRTITLNGETTKDNLNYIGGTGTWVASNNTHTVTFTASKTTNLQ